MDSEVSHRAAGEAVEGIRRREKAGPCSGSLGACTHLAAGGMPLAAAAQDSSAEACVQRAIVEDGSLPDRLGDVADSDESQEDRSTRLD